MKIIPIDSIEKNPIKCLNIENLYIDIDEEKMEVYLGTDNLDVAFKFDSKEASRDWFSKFEVYCVKIGLSRRYRLLDKIGKGGFGSVYKGEDLISGENVAMKVIEKSRIKTFKNYVRLNFESLEIPDRRNPDYEGTQPPEYCKNEVGV